MMRADSTLTWTARWIADTRPVGSSANQAFASFTMPL